MQEKSEDDARAVPDAEFEAALRAARVESDFGDRVRDARRRAGMTQRQLGDAIGVDASAISRIEQGLRAIRLGEATLIADALKLTLGELLVFNDDSLEKLNSVRIELENATSRLRIATEVAADTIDRVRSVLERTDVRQAVSISNVNVDHVIAICSGTLASFDDHDHTYAMRKIASELVEMDQPHLIIEAERDTNA